MSTSNVVLLPGLLTDAGVWQGVIAGLAPGITVRVIDLTQDDSIPAMAGRVLAETADIAAPFSVAGFSMGGYVTLELLARAPRRFARVLLQSTAMHAETAGQREFRVANIARASGAEGPANFPGICRDLISAGFSRAAQADAALVARATAMFQRLGPQVFVRQSRAVMQRADHTETLRALAARADVRVAIACGERDRITPLSWSQHMVEVCPTAQLHVIPGAGHLAPFEAPETIAGFINALVQP